MRALILFLIAAGAQAQILAPILFGNATTAVTPITVGADATCGQLGANGGPTPTTDTTGGATLYFVGAGSFFVAGANTFATTPSDTITPGSGAGSLTAAASGEGRVQPYIVVNPTSNAAYFSSNLTTPNGSFSSACVLALKHSKSSSPLDQQAAGAFNNSSATSIQPGSATALEDNEIFIACVTTNSGTTVAVDSGFTLVPNQVAFGANESITCAYKIETTGRTENPTFSWSGASNTAAIMITIKVGP